MLGRSTKVLRTSFLMCLATLACASLIFGGAVMSIAQEDQDSSLIAGNL